MTPQTPLQWIGFALHTAVIYAVAKVGPKAMIEMGTDLLICAVKFILKKKEKKNEPTT